MSDVLYIQMATSIPSTNVSLSNLCVVLGVATGAPFNAAKLYSATNITALYGGKTLPQPGQPLYMGDFRGVQRIVNTYPTDSLTTSLTFSGASFPSSVGTTSGVSVVTDGARGYVMYSAPGYANLTGNITASYTKMFWVKMVSNPPGTGTLISMSTYSGGALHYTKFADGTHLGSGHAAYAGANTNYVTDPTPPGTGWVHYAITYDNPTRRMKMYRNGTVVSDVTNSALGWSGSPDGIQLGGYTANYYYMDDVYIYNRALTDAEVLACYNGSK